MGTPQLRSRVTARGCRSSTRFRANLRTLGRQSPSLLANHSSSTLAKAGRSSMKCSFARQRGNTRARRHRPLRAGAGGQVQHGVFGVDELGCFPVDARTWGEQVDRVELVAAVVALVAAGSVVTADGAGALDVAVGKCTPGGGRHGPLGGVGEDVTVLVQRDEQLLHHVVVVAGGGRS